MIIAAAMMPIFAFSQGNVVTKDSTWQIAANGAFYEVRLVEYNTGESSLNRRLIGDTASVFSGYLARFEAEGNRMATIAFEARAFDRIIRDFLQRRDSILTSVGRDITDTLTDKYAGPLLASGWKVYDDTTQLNVEFSVNAQGQLRYQIAGFPIRNAFIIARTMRLQNYGSTGKKLDVYAAPGGNWFSIDDRVKIRLPGNQGLSRVLEPIQKPPTIAPTKKTEPTKKAKKAKKQ